jgi:sterol desaturase/sphingolipid hydroxylase (fatty acid hydroxylase superfamily)
MPWLLQFIIAVLLADLMVYITHRFLHQSKHFWKIHLIHHTSTHMNLFTSSRTHPLNAFITYFFEFGILMLLGFDQHIILTWSCFMSINGLFQHCNVDLKFGILNRFVSTAELHRIHHSTNKQDFNYNFGTTTSIWDQFFGTYKESFEDGIEYGVSNIRIRENFWELLKYPFKGITFRKVITPPGPADNS